MTGIPFPEFEPVAVLTGPLTFHWFGRVRSIVEFPRESGAHLESWMNEPLACEPTGKFEKRLQRSGSDHRDG